MQIDSITTLPAIKALDVPTTSQAPLGSLETPVQVTPGQTPPPPETIRSLGEINAPPPDISTGLESPEDMAALKSDSGSGNLPAQLVSTLYVLNHSFDIQKQMLDVLI